MWERNSLEDGYGLGSGGCFAAGCLFPGVGRIGISPHLQKFPFFARRRLPVFFHLVLRGLRLSLFSVPSPQLYIVVFSSISFSSSPRLRSMRSPSFSGHLGLRFSLHCSGVPLPRYAVSVVFRSSPSHLPVWRSLFSGTPPRSASVLKVSPTRFSVRRFRLRCSRDRFRLGGVES